MGIWLSKQWLGWKDKQQIGGDPGSLPIGLEHSAEVSLTPLLKEDGDGLTGKRH
jgi:hypothetical protein